MSNKIRKYLDPYFTIETFNAQIGDPPAHYI